MEGFDKQFIMEMFLESDSVSTMNRLIVAATDVIKENSENVTLFDKIFNKAFKELPTESNHSPEAQVNNDMAMASTYKGKYFYERIVINYNDDEYYDLFKIRRSTCQELISILRVNYKSEPTVVALEKKVHVFLWILTTDKSFLEVGNLFGLHKSTVSYIFYEIASLIAEQQCQYISWPSYEEQHLTRLKVNTHFRFPNCIGFLDACRLKVGSKRSKKGKSVTVLLQAVCDESLSFLDVHVGSIGRTKKSKVFKESSLSHELVNLVEFENHILGDTNYKLQMNLITPFSSEEVLTDEEMKFNEVHWNTNAYIGRAFELLKEKFRKLNYLDINKSDSLSTVITAACVLHNFIIVHEGSAEVKEELVSCDDGVVIDPNIVNNSSEKRLFLCNYINFMENKDDDMLDDIDDIM